MKRRLTELTFVVIIFWVRNVCACIVATFALGITSLTFLNLYSTDCVMFYLLLTISICYCQHMTYKTPLSIHDFSLKSALLCFSK